MCIQMKAVHCMDKQLQGAVTSMWRPAVLSDLQSCQISWMQVLAIMIRYCTCRAGDDGCQPTGMELLRQQLTLIREASFEDIKRSTHTNYKNPYFRERHLSADTTSWGLDQSVSRLVHVDFRSRLKYCPSSQSTFSPIWSKYQKVCFIQEALAANLY